jgi:predicted SprT family Zn-dependent metalloprotease
VVLPEIKRKHRYVAACTCAIEHVRKRRPQGTYICRRCGKKLEWRKETIRESLFVGDVTVESH